MNILALVTDAWNGHGGIAQYNRDLLSALAAESRVASITAIVRHASGSAERIPDKVHMSGPHGRTNFAAAAVAAAARIPRPFSVFCGHINFAPLACLIGHAWRAPIWLQVHGIEAWERPARSCVQSVNNVQLITAVSRFTRGRLLAWAQIDPARVKVLPNTVSSRFKPGSRRRDLMDRFALHGKTVLLTVGRLAAKEQYKGHDRVIRALPRLLEGNPDVRYLIVGDGDDRGRLESLAEKQGVRDQTVFAGAVAHEDLPDYYRLASLFVMPSTGEGFGIAFLEAAATGVPVIGCGKDGSRDALRDAAVGCITGTSVEELVDACRVAQRSGRDLTRHVAAFSKPAFNARVSSLLSSFLNA